jgi:uncharacterized protein YegP (UPF0339 family)
LLTLRFSGTAMYAMLRARAGKGFEQMLKLSDSFKFYTDYKGEWRWERISSDGRVVATSSKAYKTKAECQADARSKGWSG